METIDLIHSVVEEYVNFYKREISENIHLSMDHCINYLPYIEKDSGILHFDKSCPILLAIYFFGTPSLFHKYCVARKLFDYGYYDEAYKLTTEVHKEYIDDFASFSGLLSCNPEWIECQVAIIVSHEIGHHLYTNDCQFKNNIRKSVLNHINNFEKENKSYNPLKILYNLFYKKKLKELACDETFVEELGADTFAFNRICDMFSAIEAELDSANKELMYSSISAALSGSRYFGEYVSIVERIYFNPPNTDERKRLCNNFKNQAKKTVDDIVKTSYLENIVLNNLGRNTKNNASQIYRQLIYPRVRKFNQSMNREVCQSLQRYMKFLKEGAIVEYDEYSYNKCKQCLINFENTIYEFINGEIIKKKSERFGLS